MLGIAQYTPSRLPFPSHRYWLPLKVCTCPAQPEWSKKVQCHEGDGPHSTLGDGSIQRLGSCKMVMNLESVRHTAVGVAFVAVMIHRVHKRVF